MATILIADDNPVNRRLLSTLLRPHGHTVVEARDGSEVLAAIKSAPPDLVISDVLMPVMDGHELLRELQDNPATSGIPVVFFTAHYGARTMALAGGAAWFLTNADSAELNTVVAKVLGGEREGRPSTPAQATMGRMEARDDQTDAPPGSTHSAGHKGHVRQ